MFTKDELKTIQAEFDHRAAVTSSYEPFDGTKRHNFNMMGKDTPFFASLMEDPRFADAAEQMVGDILAYKADANRYVGNTAWHYDVGSYEGAGVHFAMYLQPVRAGTGALRMIPASHKRELFDALYEQQPLGPRWTRDAASPEETKLAMDAIDSIPA